jgi:hypothetical protein
MDRHPRNSSDLSQCRGSRSPETAGGTASIHWESRCQHGERHTSYEREVATTYRELLTICLHVAFSAMPSLLTWLTQRRIVQILNW